MTIDNELYSREDYGWWDDDRDSMNVLLRYFINPIRFAYFKRILNREFEDAFSGLRLLDVGCGGGYPLPGSLRS